MILAFLLNKIVNKRVSLSSIFFTMFCHETLRNACSVRKFELSDNEWEIMEQLHSVLKVRNTLIQCVWSNTHKFNLIGPQGCHTFLLTLNAKPYNSHPSDGPH